jgi:SAM-dependent methyltransferase
MQIGLGFWASKTLLTAVEFGLFTELAERPMDAAAIQNRFGLHERSVRDFLDALVALGMLNRSNGIYSNTPATDLYLDRAKPEYIGGILEMANARLFGFWNSLPTALRTGKPQNEASAGGNPFDGIYSTPERLEGFLKSMTGLSLPAANAIARQFPWKNYKSFIDIGCAQGGVPVTIAKTHTHLTGAGFDLATVQPTFDAYVRKHNLSDRVRFIPGDFFKDDKLPHADVLIMGHILHDWNLDEKMMLLRKAHAALPPGGALIVYEAIIDDERAQNAFGLLMSLNMLIETPGGFDFTGADCQAWMKHAGFAKTWVEHLAGPDSMVIGIK